MKNQSEEINEVLKRISRRSMITLWAACIGAAGVLLQIFFPDAVNYLSGVITIGHIIGAIIALMIFVIFPCTCIWYVIKHISQAKKPQRTTKSLDY